MDLRELPSEDEFDLMLHRHGWNSFTCKSPYNDPEVIRQRWPAPPNTNKSYTDQAFFKHFGDNTFRKLLRAIFSRPRTHEELERSYGRKKLPDYLSFLIEQGIVIQEESNLFRKSPQYRNIEGIGKTLEWYVAEWFRLSLKAPARHGVHIPGIGDGGDLDVVAFVNGLKIYIECKSGNPANITEVHLELFLRRTAAFHPDIALLLIDTDQKVEKQSKMLNKVCLQKFVELNSSRGRRLNIRCVHVRNIDKSIDKSLRDTLHSHCAYDDDDRPLVRMKTIEQWLKEAVSHAKGRRWAEAYAAYAHVARLDPSDYLAYEKQGDMLCSLERYEEASIVYQEALLLNPTRAKVYQKRGDVLNKLKQYEEASVDYEKALLLKPNYQEKRDMLYKLERYEEALIADEKNIQLGYTDRSFSEDDLSWAMDRSGAYMNKGETLFKLGRYEEALAAYDEGIQTYPHSFYYYLKGAVLMELSCYEEALVAFEEAIGADVNNLYAYEGKADTFFHLERYEEALAAYDQAISFQDTIYLFRVYIGKGNTLFHLERYEEALAAYNKALVKYEENYEKFIYANRKVELVSIYNGMGDAFQSLGRLEEAQQTYERAKQLMKQLPELKNNPND